MANVDEDDGLDDFFAKKDNKKGKKSKKNKFVAADLLEDGSQTSAAPTPTQKSEKTKKKKKPRDKSDAGKSTGDNSKKEEDEEWIEVDEKEVTYEGLKIKALQIVDDAEQDRENQEQDDDEDDDSPGSKNTNTGPWANVAVSQQAVETGSQESGDQPPEVPKEEPTKAAPAKYVPPGLRKAMAEGTGASAPVRRRNPKVAPDIQSEMHFPSLGQTSNTSDRLKEKELERENPKNRFETVKGGNRQLEDTSKHGLQLEIENKFDLLQEDN